jgi:hypothetical protein
MRWHTETLRGTRSCTVIEMVSGNGVGTLSGESGDRFERPFEFLLSCEEHGMSKVPNTRTVLKKEYGGAGEDIKLREDIFHLGCSNRLALLLSQKGH